MYINGNQISFSTTDQKNIWELRLKNLIYLAVENENCRNEAMDLISWKYNFTKVYIEYNGY